jgi:virginiamycin A acetyltransferase
MDGRVLAPAFSHAQIRVGRHTYGLRRESFTSYHPDDRIEIGAFCSIADGVKFVFGNHAMDRVSTFPFRAVCFGDSPHADAESKGNIIIGNDVWIGACSVILSGVKIGDGAVIASGAVVSKDVAPYSVVGGVPAKLIKYRLESEQITSLLAIRWWEWPDSKIRDNADLFYGDVDAFIRQHSKR